MILLSILGGLAIAALVYLFWPVPIDRELEQRIREQRDRK